MGRSPLHLAAENGYTQTIKMLLSFHTNLLDQTCKKGVNCCDFKKVALNEILSL